MENKNIFICEECKSFHNGTYGTGKFCSKHCKSVYIGKLNKNNHKCNFKNIKAPYGRWKCNYCNYIAETRAVLVLHKHECHSEMMGRNYGPNKSLRPAWNKGLTKETDPRIKKYGMTFSTRAKHGEYKNLSHPHSKETRELLSKIRSEYLAKAENAGGFKDVGWYKIKNIENNEYIVRGLWEYNVAKRLNELNILWIRNKYLNYYINNIKKIYNPDFYLPTVNEYIEVKGYFSEKDKIKMDAVIDQNPDIQIRFMQSELYNQFIFNTCSIKDIPLYKFGEFNSGYKRKGIKII